MNTSIKFVKICQSGFIALLPAILISFGLFLITLEINFKSINTWDMFTRLIDKDQANRIVDACFQESVYRFKQQRVMGSTTVVFGNDYSCDSSMIYQNSVIQLLTKAEIYQSKSSHSGVLQYISDTSNAIIISEEQKF